MDERTRVIGRNEATFRAVNERLESLNHAFGDITQELRIVCECGSADCAQQITIPADDYERVRADPALFVIVPGHEAADVEGVVERGEGYDVIRKRGGLPTRLAAEAR